MTAGWDAVLPEEISLQRRRGEASRRIRDGRPVLEGRHEWIVEGPPHFLNEIVEEGTGYAERLGERVVLLDFGNAVGFVDIPLLGTVEVVSGKWGRSDFDAMLNDVVARSAELPFRAAETGALPYVRSVSDRRRILYHCFVYLRHVLSDDARPEDRLDRAYRTVLREPHRERLRTRRTVTVGRARRIDGKSLQALMADTDEFVDVRSSRGRSTALSRALGGRLPARVDEREERASVDTAENRFLKTFLDQIERIVDDVEALVRESDRKLLRRRVLPECEALRRKLRPVFRHSIWRDVGEMTSVPSASTVLQRRRGYRELFRHYSRLRMAAHLPLSEQESRDLLEIKDIALLYELWTFFRLSEVLEQHLGPPADAMTLERSALEAGLRLNTRIRWPGGVNLTYNSRFSRSKGSAQHSYSLPLRPDIALEIPTGPNAGLHLFDAKFRLRKIRDVIPDEKEEAGGEASGEGDPKAAERRGNFKRGDLYKMHTYRDAIPRVASVWILYPGSVGRFYSTDGTRWGEVGEGGLPTYISGVGAVPLAPSRGGSPAVIDVLRRMVRSGLEVGCKS